MRYFDSLPENFTLKVQALLLAVIIWVFIAMAQEKTSELTVPVVLANLPPRIKVAEGPPSTLHVGISGPRYALVGLEKARLAAVLDMKDAGPGTVAFANLDRFIHLRDGLRVIRVQPAKIEMTLVRGE
jgi:YbbR domain-containing protein